MDLHTIIIRPVITEKSMSGASKNKFTFQVAKQADKKTIKKAIEKKFGVNVLKVESSIRKGKKKRSGVQRREVIGSDWKKAVVTLKEGQKIDLFDVGQ